MTSVRLSGVSIAPYVPAMLRRISWPAVGAGVGVAFLVQLLLGIYGHLHQCLMGVGVGMSTMDSTHIQTFVTAHFGGIPGLCWWGLSLIALLLGSGVASRVAAASYRHEGMLHGLLTWGVVMLCTLCLPATVLGHFMSSTLGALAAAAHTASQASLGIMPAPLIGALVAVLGGAMGTLRRS